MLYLGVLGNLPVPLPLILPQLRLNVNAQEQLMTTPEELGSASEVITPTIAGCPINISRSQLWNLVETVERRPDSQLARSIILVLPTEIDNPSKIQLVREFIEGNFTEIGMIADLSIHQIDCDNPYACILLTMRVSIVTPTGEIQFGRKNRTWNNRVLIKQKNEIGQQ